MIGRKGGAGSENQRSWSNRTGNFGNEKTDGDLDEPPDSVKFTTRMQEDVSALLRLTDFSSPPKRRVRSKRISFVTYGFGDASGKGFGTALKLWNGVVLYRQGIWEYRITDEQSSNYREVRNLVYSLERAAEKGLLNGTEIWMFTDNSVVAAEAAFFSWIIQVEGT